jgi:hypothetical protein
LDPFNRPLNHAFHGTCSTLWNKGWNKKWNTQVEQNSGTKKWNNPPLLLQLQYFKFSPPIGLMLVVGAGRFDVAFAGAFVDELAFAVAYCEHAVLVDTVGYEVVYT